MAMGRGGGEMWRGAPGRAAFGLSPFRRRVRCARHESFHRNSRIGRLDSIDLAGRATCARTADSTAPRSVRRVRPGRSARSGSAARPRSGARHRPPPALPGRPLPARQASATAMASRSAPACTGDIRTPVIPQTSASCLRTDSSGATATMRHHGRCRATSRAVRPESVGVTIAVAFTSATNWQAAVITGRRSRRLERPHLRPS